jgi:hypothetical protein
MHIKAVLTEKMGSASTGRGGSDDTAQRARWNAYTRRLPSNQ